MKRSICPIRLMALTAMMLFLTGSLLALNIFSKVTGGNWNNANTWVGGVIPGAADNVTIVSGSTVSTDGSFACNNLTVYGTLQNTGGTHYLTVNGMVMNQGTIQNASNQLWVTIYGHITNNGTWSNYRVELKGTNDHHIVCLGSHIFSCVQFMDTEAMTGTIYLDGHVTFSGTLVEFNYSSLVISSSVNVLTVYGAGSALRKMNITGNHATISTDANCYLQNLTVSNITLTGVARVNACVFNENLNLPGIMESYGSNPGITISGTLNINGGIRNGSSNLAVYLGGNVTYNGSEWSNNQVYLNGGSTQNVSFGYGKKFTGTSFILNQSINLLTDVIFEGTLIDCNYHTITPLPGSKIIIIGIVGQDKGIIEANLISDNNKLIMSKEAVIRNSTVTGMIWLEGIVRIHTYASFESVIVSDTLEAGSSGPNLDITSAIINNGVIRDQAPPVTKHLNVYIQGDITNNFRWYNYSTTVNGTTNDQTIYFAPSITYTGPTFNVHNSSRDIYITSDLSFNGTNLIFEYNDSPTCYITDGSRISVKGSGNYVSNTRWIANTFSLHMHDGAVLRGNGWMQNATLEGIIKVFDSNVFMRGNSHVKDTLENNGTSNHTITFEGSLANEGLIRNGSDGGLLKVIVQGDLINNGNWSIQELVMENNGASQQIRLVSGQPINSPVKFKANGISPFNWYKNGQYYATGNTLTFTTLTLSNYGDYYCSSQPSRHIVVQYATAVNFNASETVGCAPKTVAFTDATISASPIQSWNWDFGDGSFSSEQNPTHIFQNEGVYSVTLTVDDGYFDCPLTKTDYITVHGIPSPDFSFENICLGQPMYFEDLSAGQNLEIVYDVQFASTLIGYSSQWNPVNWAAYQALGVPDVYPNYADDPHAWASLTASSQREFLELGYATPRRINKVSIYETLMPGSVDSVFVKNPSTGHWELFWSGTAVQAAKEARIFEVTSPTPTSYPVSQIRIAFNSPVIAYWSEIDAVSISAPIDTIVSASTTYLWDVGENGVTYTTKGDINHLYTTPGTHDVTLSITNNGICTDLITKTVEVYTPHEITGQPVDPPALCDSTGVAIIEVTTTGTASLFFWQIWNVNFWDMLYDDEYYSGTRNSALIISRPVLSMDGSQYRCIVAGPCGSLLFSNTVELTVVPSMYSGDILGDGTTRLGDPTPLLTVADPGATVIQWQRRFELGAWEDIAHSGNTFSEVPNAIGRWDYRAQITGGSCTFTDFATVQVLQKELNITLMIEGLYDPGNGMMLPVMDEFGYHYGSDIADHISIGIAQSTAPYTILHIANDVELDTDGSCSLIVPAPLLTSYYLIIEHRNSIETWSALPVSFAPGHISYDYTPDAAMAYGDNLLQIGSDYVIYSGDANQDGIIDTNDLGEVDNDAQNFAMGYLATDVNGDGVVDTNDMGIVDNNSQAFIMVMAP
ncbi:MAG: PKD domain-containing protein [Bacteroidetes bacterium]|nr:PKD domain-containing protein [Bacteroidota bacterium]